VIHDFRSAALGRLTLETPEEFAVGWPKAKRPMPSGRSAKNLHGAPKTPNAAESGETFFVRLTDRSGWGQLAHLCCTLDSADDAFMRPTTAQVFVQGLTNLRPSRLGQCAATRRWH
jgi:hypothetical protein